MIPAFVACAAMAQTEITVDYDPDARFRQYHTYAFATDTEDTLAEAAPERHEQLLAMLRKHLDQNLREVTTDPDLWVLYKVAAEDVVEMNTQYEYAYGDDWSRFDSPDVGMPRPTTREQRYRLGTLVIDAWDADTRKLVWRGVASDAVAANPDVTMRRISKAIDRIARDWQRMRRQGAGE
jgi:hypothetical protein